MRKRKVAGAVAGLVAVAGIVAAVNSPLGAQTPDRGFFSARLRGFEEVPAISTNGNGSFTARLAGSTLQYDLSYSMLEGGAVAQAHIHLGQAGVNGGVMAFLCGGGGKPACPVSGTISGTVAPADVIGPPGQGVAAGEFLEMVRALRAGVGYANVHTTTWPGGEIRGQIAGN